jgi:pantoate--beta-alanine ligase
MDIIQTPDAMQQRALELKRQGRVIGFVPTMGFLHEGHLSLMRLARKRCDILVVSIFVNPSQFGPNEDLDAYPRDIERDEDLCREEGVDLVFYPEPTDMYAADASVWVDEDTLSGVLCGAARPGHFRGVCTVVAKLFNLVQPDLAVFGEKDAQQLRIIERMVRDLNVPVEILRGPIIRESDGLAMSSRNTYLSGQQREHALCLKQALDCARSMIEGGEREVDTIRNALQGVIEDTPGAVIDYIGFSDDETLAEVQQINGRVLVALAVKIGAVRLIDNAVFEA